jgi:hypothetical protein
MVSSNVIYSMAGREQYDVVGALASLEFFFGGEEHTGNSNLVHSRQ